MGFYGKSFFELKSKKKLSIPRGVEDQEYSTN